MPQALQKDKVEFTTNAILSYLIDNKLKIGSKLPSEEEFTRLFGVSRLCVREALRGLKFLGVVETGTRRGTTVKDVDFTLLMRALGFQFAVSNVSYAELCHARMLVERGAIDILIDRASETALDELDSLAYCGSEDLDPEECRARDRVFHKRLVTLTGSTILLALSQLLDLFFSRPSEKALSSDSKQEEVNTDHRLLVKAIRDQNRALAFGILYNHMGGYAKIYGNLSQNKICSGSKKKEEK